jgi:AcrR family transcriptional regulator
MDRFERQKHESRTRLLDAAYALFRFQGMERTTIDQICERAEVSPRTFFNHFPRRDDLVLALATERLRHLGAVLAERPDAGLPALLDEVAGFLESSGPAYRQLLGPMSAVEGAGPERGGELHATLTAFVRQAVARGEITDQHDPLVLADVIAGAVSVALRNWTLDDGYSIRAGLRELAAVLSDVLAPATS